MVARPILEPRLHDLQLEREDTLEKVSTGFRRVEAIQYREQVRAFCCCLVEEAETSEAG
jgi:hypothetical protein